MKLVVSILMYVLMPLLCLASLTLSAPVFSQAQDDPAVSRALQQVQNMLTNPMLREEQLNKSPEARAAANKLESLGGSTQMNEEVYALSAQIFSDLVNETGGDIKKLRERVAAAQKNPEAFLNSLKSDHKTRIRSIAQQLPSN